MCLPCESHCDVVTSALGGAAGAEEFFRDAGAVRGVPGERVFAGYLAVFHAIGHPTPTQFARMIDPAG